MVNKLLFVFLFFSLTKIDGFSQDAKFKALFMYNFTKYIEWPVEKQRGDFIIGIYGTSPITQELRIIADKKKVGTQTIVIKEFDTPAGLSSCNILYIPENRSAKIDEVAGSCSGRGTVLITDKPGLAKTVSGLNYIKIDGRQSFEINKANLEKQGVKVNSVLLSLGIIVQ